MSGTVLHVTEHSLASKTVRQAFPTKVAAVAYARERVLDPEVASVSVWAYVSELDARNALMATVSGRDWYDKRKLVVVIVKKTVKVSK